MKRLSPRVVDVAIAVAVLVAGVTEAAISDAITGSRWAAALVASALSVTLLWRRSHPAAACVAAIAIAVPAAAFLIDPTELIVTFFPILILAYSGGAYAAAREARVGAAVLALGTVAVGLAAGSPAQNTFFPPLIVLLCWLGGRTVRTRSHHAAELHETAALAAERREHEALQAVAEERRRIAREMHDVVAHSISIMVVQAGGARRILATDPERAERAAARIRHAGSDALAEMDILLGVLETDPEEAVQPSLDALDELVARTREAGLPVTLDVRGSPRSLSAGAESALYRVVQEALTNAIKHAGGAATHVELTWGSDALELRVADDGDGGLSPQLTGAGHGLIGMQERITVHGGELEAGPRIGGGFEVVARVPLEPRTASTA